MNRMSLTRVALLQFFILSTLQLSIQKYQLVYIIKINCCGPNNRTLFIIVLFLLTASSHIVPCPIFLSRLTRRIWVHMLRRVVMKLKLIVLILNIFKLIFEWVYTLSMFFFGGLIYINTMNDRCLFFLLFLVLVLVLLLFLFRSVLLFLFESAK